MSMDYIYLSEDYISIPKETLKFSFKIIENYFGKNGFGSFRFGLC